MIRIKNTFILGTSHISEASVKEIKHWFEEINPDIVAVELDRPRLHGLLTGEKPSFHPRLIRQIGLSGYLFAAIGGYMQKKLGNLVGMNPGSEMKEAALLAREKGKKLALIDQDVRVTLKSISKAFTFRQKARVLFELLFAPFSKKIRIDLTKVPQRKTIVYLLKLLRERYPGLYSPLIDERNKFMAQKLLSLSEAYPDDKILVIVGAGHIEGLSQLLNKETYLNKKAEGH